MCYPLAAFSPGRLGDTPPAAAFATGDDLDHSIRQSP
jgi:hypothetical protein